MKNLVFEVVALAVVMVVTASNPAGAQQAAAPKKLRIACVETSKIPLEVVQRELQGKQAIELVLFDKNVDAIRATQDGSTDAALAVHKKFMEKFMAPSEGNSFRVV